MSDEYIEVIRAQCVPLEPLPTEVEPSLRPLAGLRAVLFDIYGTLLISASGEVGSEESAARSRAMLAALEAVAAPVATAGRQNLGDQAVAAFTQTIHDCHAQSQTQGLPYPEVEIRDVWRRTLTLLVDGRWLDATVSQLDVSRLAIENEIRGNPVWPMPGLNECLRQLRSQGLVLGIVSNAQFYTPLLFPALLGSSLEDLGFDPELQWYSYRNGRAKPDVWLFEQPKACLERRGVNASEVAYVGNDMLNDVLPASRVGFRTVLFAGDARSLRWRHGDARVAGIVPDLVVTNLAMLSRCVEGG